VPRRLTAKLPRREKDLEGAHVRELEALGWRCWKQSGLGRAGRPDRHLMGPLGEDAHVEWKREGEAPTPLQAQELDELERMGHLVAACDSLVGARMFVEEVSHHVYMNRLHTTRPQGWRRRWREWHPKGPDLPPTRARRG
jgi:hypothetical protein